MDIKTASKLIEDNLHNIYAWAYSKVFDKQTAEDLAQDIILAALKSADRLENDGAFWKYFWRIADNVLRTYIRKNKNPHVEFDEKFVGVYMQSPEDNIIKSEEIKLLRRELSILSKMYREVTVKHYIYGKSCKEIANELNISVEMAKFYLHKTRKMLKEGVGMTREYGEKSYNPQIFKMDFWGGDTSGYWELFERILPGNILLSAYDKPMSVSELSLELGVAAVYLEEEIAILEKMDVIKKSGDKYQTNIIILRNDFEKKAIEYIKPLCREAAEKIKNEFEKIKSEIQKIDYYGKNSEENDFKWTFINIGLRKSLFDRTAIVEKSFGNLPPLANGSYGFVTGHDNNYENLPCNGYYGQLNNKNNSAFVSVQNFKIIKNVQWWHSDKNFENSVEALCDAVLFNNADENNVEFLRMVEKGFINLKSGKLSPAFPVFSKETFDAIQEIVTPLSKIAIEIMNEICPNVSKMLQKEVPLSLRKHCLLFVNYFYQLTVICIIIESLVEIGYLTVPEKRTNLCMFGVQM